MSDLNTEIRQEFEDLESKLRDIEYTFCHLNSINKKLQADLALAREGLEFYGDKESWSSPLSFDPEFKPAIKLSDVKGDKIERTQWGGKKAREILAQLDKKDGE